MAFNIPDFCSDLLAQGPFRSQQYEYTIHGFQSQNVLSTLLSVPVVFCNTGNQTQSLRHYRKVYHHLAISSF